MNLSIASMALRGSLSANGLRLALTLASIALGVALGGAVHTVHSSALAEIDRAAHALSGSADVEVRGARSGFDERLLVTLAQRPEVAVASPVVELEVALAGAEGTIRVMGIDAFRAARLQPAFVDDASRTGVGNVAALLDAGHAWLTPSAMAAHGMKTGATLRLVGAGGVQEAKIAGELPALASAGEMAVMDIAAVQQRFGRVGSISRVDIRLRPGVDRDRFMEDIAPSLPAGVVAAPARSISARAAAITRAYRVNLDALALVALATGAFLVFSTLALQAARRRQEFALLRALGVTRAGVYALLAMEGAAIGALGAIAGTVLGVAASRVLLSRAGADLGAGFFSGRGAVFAVDKAALAAIALLGVGMSVAAALWVARAVGRMPVAEALRDRAIDLPLMKSRGGTVSLLLAAAGVPMLFMGPVGGLPLAGYAAIALWLAAAVAAVGPLCRALLRRITPSQSTVAALALAQVRHLPGHLAASVAGIVVSAALCVAMAIMVFSFRESLRDWLGGVVHADLYARASEGETGFFTLEQQRRVAALPQVAALETLRYDRLALSASGPPVSLVARPIDERILRGFRAEPATMPAPSADVHVWISEAARDLHGWSAGERIVLPIAGKPVAFRVAGLIHDYARTWGAVLIRSEDYRRLTADPRVNDLAVTYAAGVDAPRAEAAVRDALGEMPGMLFEDARDLRRRSLAIFDRSFAVTYALEAIAIVIGLAGVTSSFAALAWSRRREFGVLRFLGLTRGEVLRMLALEGAATGALGTLIGLAAGAAISIVLLKVVNRQSFHWNLDVHWPLVPLAALAAAIVVFCAIGARASGAIAVRREAVLAVKDDA